MKPIVIIVVLVFAFIAGYSFYSKKESRNALNSIKQQGVSIDLVIDARPIVAIDAHDNVFYIINQQEVRKLVFAQINLIKLIESPEKSNNASEKLGPDYGVIELNNGESIRFGDMPDTAMETKVRLGQFEALLGKVLVVESR